VINQRLSFAPQKIHPQPGVNLSGELDLQCDLSNINNRCSRLHPIAAHHLLLPTAATNTSASRTIPGKSFDFEWQIVTVAFLRTRSRATAYQQYWNGLRQPHSCLQWHTDAVKQYNDTGWCTGHKKWITTLLSKPSYVDGMEPSTSFSILTALSTSSSINRLAMELDKYAIHAWISVQLSNQSSTSFCVAVAGR